MTNISNHFALSIVFRRRYLHRLLLSTPTFTTATGASVQPHSAMALAASGPRRPTVAPEPGPEWRVARLQWGLSWPLHWIGLGLAFAFLACRSLLAIIRSPDVNSRFARRNLFYAINWLLVALGTTRSLYLMLDPYESGENIANCPLWVVRPLFGIAFPCLMSAFCLVHVAFLEVAKIKLVSPKLSSIRFISGIILVHFAVVVVSDTTTAIEANRTELLIVCQSFFVIWGLLNSISFIYSGTRVVVKTRNIRNRICDMENAEWNLQMRSVDQDDAVKKHENTAKKPNTLQNDCNAAAGLRVAHTIQPPMFSNHLTADARDALGRQEIPSPEPKFTKRRKHSISSFAPTRRERALQKIAGITIMASVLSSCCCALQVYSFFGVYGAYSTVIVSPKPWPWLAFQTSFRLVELSMAYMLSYCVLRSDACWLRGLLTRLVSLRRAKKTRAPRIKIIRVKDPVQGDLA